MYFWECILILFWMVVVPFLIGTFVVNQLFKVKNPDLLLTFVCGSISMLAIFYVLEIPMQYFKVHLSVLVLSWKVIIPLICIMVLFLNRKDYKDILKNYIKQFRQLSWGTIIIILLVFAQGVLVALFQHVDADDAFYVASATTAVSTDSIFQFDPFTGLPLAVYPSRYLLSPFPIFIALLSKLVLIHPTIIAHTLLPVFLIPLSYAIMAVLGKKLFQDRSSSVQIFMFLLCVINIFGNVSIYTSSTFMLFRIWQGKAVLASIILPAVFYFSFRTMSGDNKPGEWVMLFCCVLAACLSSSMGILLTPIMIMCLGIVFAIRNRSLRTVCYSLLCCAPCVACLLASIVY